MSPSSKNKTPRKRGRPVKRKRGPPKTSDKSLKERHREASQRYNKAHPEVHRKAVKRYQENNPEVQRRAAKRYNAKKKLSYTGENDEINKLTENIGKKKSTMSEYFAEVNIKTEPICTDKNGTENIMFKTEMDCDEVQIKLEAADRKETVEDLYPDHDIKQEIVIGPVNVQCVPTTVKMYSGDLSSGHYYVCVPVEQDNMNTSNTPDVPNESLKKKPTPRKRGRPVKRKRDPPKTSDKSLKERHREASQRYNKVHPEVNRKAVKRYQEKNPEVQRRAAKRYIAKKKLSYTGENDEINKLTENIGKKKSLVFEYFAKVSIKTEPICTDENGTENIMIKTEMDCGEVQIKLESADHVETVEDLYPDHDIKQEIEIGPVNVQCVPTTVKIYSECAEQVSQSSLGHSYPVYSTDLESTLSRQTLYESLPGNSELLNIQEDNNDNDYHDEKSEDELPNTKRQQYTSDRKHKPKKANSKIDKKFSCDLCSQRFIHHNVLLRHRSLHANGEPFNCDICKKIFEKRSQMLNHRKVHSLRGEKPYSCSICKKHFSGKTVLLSHQRIHSGEKPFSCIHCMKTFSHRTVLIRHLRIHNPENSFICDFCKRGFKLEDELQRHLGIIYVRGGKRPYSCDGCDQKFSSKCKLIFHQRGCGGC